MELNQIMTALMSGNTNKNFPGYKKVLDVIYRYTMSRSRARGIANPELSRLEEELLLALSAQLTKEE